MKHLTFVVTISALDAETSVLNVETSAFGAATSAIAQRSFDVETSVIARSYRHRIFGNIGDCGVGVTQQMCNRVTNHRDIGTFSRPESSDLPMPDLG